MINDSVSERLEEEHACKRFYFKLKKSKTPGIERREKAEQERRFKY